MTTKDASGMKASGFTLAELMISLAMVGIISTFTIGKVLKSQQFQKYNAIAREAMAMMSDAYLQHKNLGLATANTKAKDLTPYLNYLALDSTSTVDDSATYGSLSCVPNHLCAKLHNGAKIHFYDMAMGGTSNTHHIAFFVDPDGVYGGSTTGMSKSAGFVIYYNGRITTQGVDDNNPARDPEWLQW